MWSFVAREYQVVQGRRALRDSIRRAREPSLSVVGQTIGSYSILRQLGAGAMGEVYLAEHRHLKRKAALKLLAPGLVGRPDLLERFFLEARATSAIAHAGIVQIFDCEVDATGRPYIVMEYLEGDTLAAVLAKRGPVPAAPAARLARSMAEALEAAHAKGIVHRDLKPENVFVLGEPPEAAKLVDFGIAKLAGDFRAAQVHQTRTGAMMGTPLYMSPEQCRDSGKIDHHTDMYSLGCVLFEMLTGRPPFTHDALGELIVAHMTAPPPDARAINAGIPAALAELANDLLKKTPSERPSMRQVSERMTGFIAGLTTVPGPDGETVARPASRPPKATTFGNAASELVTDTLPVVALPRGRGRAVALVLAAAAILVGGGVFASRALRSDGPGTAAVAPPAATTATTTTTTAKTGTTKAAAATAIAPTPTPAIARPSGTTGASAADGERPSSKDRPSQRPAAGGKRAGTRRSSESKAVAPEPRPVEPSAAAEPPPKPSAAAALTPPPPPPAATPRTTSDLTGTWEGPWTDPAKQQSGRLQLQIGANGAVAGWMTNAAARQSYRMVGRLAPGGRLDLACQCPRDQLFWARGTLRASGDEAKGQLTLQSATAVFGQSQVTLRHAAPR